jgi:hypothetical protein
MKVAIVSGTVYGTAEEVARHAQARLQAAGFEAWHQPRVQRAELEAFAPQALLVVTATTGMGELPDNLQALYASRPGTACRRRYWRWGIPVMATASVPPASRCVSCMPTLACARYCRCCVWMPAKR